MSLEVLNRIVGEAIINASFCRALLSDPGAAVRDYELGADELAVLSSIRAGSVDNLAQQIIAGLDLERPSAPRLSELGGRLFSPGVGHSPGRSSLQASRSASSSPPKSAARRLVLLPAAC